jgi:hypothetical protein
VEGYWLKIVRKREWREGGWGADECEDRFTVIFMVMVDERYTYLAKNESCSIQISVF